MKETSIENNWPITEFYTIDDVKSFFSNPQKKGWIYRGQSKHYKLLPPIDREPFTSIPRIQKLWLEKQSILQFVEAIRFTADETEKQIITMNFNHSRTFNEYRIPVLMLMQHHFVPTRLLDWTLDPEIALFFAATNDFSDFDNEDGEVWGFNVENYNKSFGDAQWPKNPEVYYPGTNDVDTYFPCLFCENEPKGNWFLMQELRPKFPRMQFQKGFFSITSKFGEDHSIAIQRLFDNDSSNYHRYVVDKKLKPLLRDYLRKDGIWQGSLFPDITGVANALRKTVFGINSK